MQNQIPKNWQLKKLTELGELNRGRSRHRPRDAKALYGGSYPFIQTGDIKASNGRITSYTQTYSEDGLRQSRMWPKDTICITIAANIADLGKLTFPACFPDSVIGFLADKTKSDPDFILYALQSLKRNIRSYAVGSAQDNINLGTFENILIPTPKDVEEQKNIALYLSIIDDKIEINNKIAKVLEEMAQALFKEWFVKFKFPGYEKVGLINSELGKIPKGWEIGILEDLVNIRNGFAFKSSDYKNVGVPIVRTTNFNDTSSIELNDMVFLSEETAKKYQNFYLKSFDFLLVMVGASVGKWAIVPSNILPALQNQNMWDFMPIKEKYRFFNIYLLKKMIREQKGSTTGSARDFFRKDYFYSLNAFIPDSEILHKFNFLVKPIHKRLDTILNENQKLAALRDLLLPKLMKGEIKVN